MSAQASYGTRARSRPSTQQRRGRAAAASHQRTSTSTTAGSGGPFTSSDSAGPNLSSQPRAAAATAAATATAPTGTVAAGTRPPSPSSHRESTRQASARAAEAALRRRNSARSTPFAAAVSPDRVTNPNRDSGDGHSSGNEATTSSDGDTFAEDYQRMQEADDEDRSYICPFSLGFATDQPVYWNGHYYEREMLMHFINSETTAGGERSDATVPCPVTRLPVWRWRRKWRWGREQQQ